MKKIAALMAGLLSYAILNAAPTIFVVDMGTVYQNYYKAKEAAAQIKSSEDMTRQELEKMNKERQALEKDLTAVQEKVNNPALTEAAKKKIIEEAQPTVVKMRQIEQNMQNVANQARERLQQNVANIRKVHLDEIKAVIAKIAAEKKADFILEKGACWFAEPKSELTQDVIKAINASAPTTKPAKVEKK